MLNNLGAPLIFKSNSLTPTPQPQSKLTTKKEEESLIG